MGYTKHNEDDTLIRDERFELKFGVERKPKVDIIRYECPYCDVVFDSKDALYSHIKDNHNILSPVIMVNGKVVQESMYVSTIETAHVFIYGFEVDILINGVKIDSIEINNEVDIKDYIFTEQDSSDICDITVGTKSVKIIRYSSESIDNRAVMKVIDKWEEQTRNGIMISMEDATFSNGAEERYLQALFNYFLACNATENDKYFRYNDAYSILKEFNNLTFIGSCIMKVIAFRLNWGGKLKKLCLDENDEFTKICLLYEGREFEEDCVSDRVTGKVLYVEDDVQACINAMIDLYDGNFESVKEYLSNFEFVEDISDANLRDRIYYIWYKLSLFEGKEKQARRYVENILNYDFFE